MHKVIYICIQNSSINCRTRQAPLWAASYTNTPSKCSFPLLQLKLLEKKKLRILGSVSVCTRWLWSKLVQNASTIVLESGNCTCSAMYTLR